MYRIFKSHCRNYVLPTCATHKENSVDAQNPNHTCPLTFLCLLHDKCRLSRKSLISVIELKSLVLVLRLEPWVFVNIPANFTVNTQILKDNLLTVTTTQRFGSLRFNVNSTVNTFRDNNWNHRKHHHSRSCEIAPLYTIITFHQKFVVTKYTVSNMNVCKIQLMY